MGETQHIIGKILRHGYESHNPFDTAKRTNRELLERELGDVVHAVERMCDEGDLQDDKIKASADIKSATVGRWLHHQIR